MYPGVVLVTFVAQLLLVSAFLLLAVRRARTSRTSTLPGRARVEPHPLRAARRGVRPDRDATIDSRVRGAHDELALLAEERERLVRELELLRAEHAKEESHFRRRRREVLLEMHEHRRITTGLRAEELPLREHVRNLRAEVDHLEHRSVSLAEEVAASIEKSAALRQRIIVSQRELTSRRLDRERVERRIRSAAEHLRDLARRRALLRAETEELAALLELLQQLSGQPETLTALSDGELRRAPTSRAEAAARVEVNGTRDVPVTGPSTMVGRDRSTR
jgi:chromosome segregation ATPase